MRRNEASAEGRELGHHMARFCDDAEPAARLKVPDLPPRCMSCAFREGKHVASRSPETQMGALKCVVERTPFYCHDVHREGQLCSGWAMMVLASDGEPIHVPWEFPNGTDLPPVPGRMR